MKGTNTSLAPFLRLSFRNIQMYVKTRGLTRYTYVNFSKTLKGKIKTFLFRRSTEELPMWFDDDTFSNSGKCHFFQWNSMRKRKGTYHARIFALKISTKIGERESEREIVL